MSDKQCAECGYYRGHHADTCGHTTPDELRRRLKNLHERNRREQTACDIQLRRMKEQLTLYQGKFHALRHENNKLRRRLNINALQPTIRERAIEALKQLKGWDMHLEPEEAKRLYELNIRSLVEDFAAIKESEEK